MLTVEQAASYHRWPAPELEHKFCERRWRFDYAWPEIKLAVEIEGGGWVRGRHNRPAGYENDCKKYNTAVLLGWRVLRFTPLMIREGWHIKALRECFGGNHETERSSVRRTE